MVTAPHAAAILVALTAVVCDLKTHRIPNELTLGSALLALIFYALSSGWHGALFAVLGLLVGLGLFFPLFALRALGAGDVKLLGALGAWLGPVLAMWTALYAGIAGGVLAIVVALGSRYLWRALRNLWGLLLYWRAVGVRPMPGLTLADAAGPRLAYALPISVGAMVTLWLRA